MWKGLRILRALETITHRLEHEQRDFEKERHLVFTPPVGTPVVLLVDSRYLREHHGAAPGQLGTVTHHSKLSRDDTGVLVNWGLAPNDRVRMDLHELRLPADA